MLWREWGREAARDYSYKLVRMRAHFSQTVRILSLASLIAVSSHVSNAASLPGGFTQAVLTSDLSSPTAMALAPDGRIFVAEQGGDLRVVKNGALLAVPFVSLPVNSDGERGLLGVTFDPGFASNHFVYVYYTSNSPTLHNRVSRFIAGGDVAAPGSETVIFDLDDLSDATNHNGGAIHFGPDGKLYVAAGENANGANSQSLATVLGKLLRLNADGSAPSDNPFFGSTTGKNRAIWAIGLRNPYTFSFQPGSGRLFINDVGQSTWEEVNDGIAGSNYGWPTSEGVTANPSFRSPLLVYDHGQGCAITGGTFYNPATQQFPIGYGGKYFYADFCGGWIHRFDPATHAVSSFATGIDGPVDLLVEPSGALLYLAHGSGSLVRVSSRLPSPVGAGLGLIGSYFDNLSLSGPSTTRLDSQVNFDWANGIPIKGIDGDTFSVRWTGQVRAKVSGPHTFITRSDDGVRLWVNNRRIIDDWTDHSPLEDRGAISLVAGQLYDIRLEFYEDFGTAVIQLFWSAPGLLRQIIPQANLFPYALLLTGEPPTTAADGAIRDRLLRDGMAPVVARAATASVNDAKGKALILLSSTVDPATVRGRFRTTPVPLFSWEPGLFGDLGMTGSVAGSDFGTVPAQNRLQITAAGRALAAGLSGTITVGAAPSAFSFGVPGTAALVVARQVGGAARPVLFAYERGAAMHGLAAPARRLGLFLGNTTAGLLTDQGWALFDAAVKWAVKK